MYMYACPHCRKPGISLVERLFYMRFSGAVKCRACGCKVGEDRQLRKLVLLLCVFSALVIFALYRDDIRFLLLGLLFFGAALQFVSHRLVPLVKAGPSKSKEALKFRAAPSRPLTQLAEGDLVGHPIWANGADAGESVAREEIRVFPTTLDTVPMAPLRFYVAAQATLANGGIYPALVKVVNMGGKDNHMHLHGLFVAGTLIKCDGSPATSEGLGQRIGQQGAALYPIAWRLRVCFEYETRLRHGVERLWAGPRRPRSR